MMAKHTNLVMSERTNTENIARLHYYTAKRVGTTKKKLMEQIWNQMVLKMIQGIIISNVIITLREKMYSEIRQLNVK